MATVGNFRLGTVFWARMLLGTLFAYAGISHASNSYRFFQSVVAYDLLSVNFSIWVATVLPFLQLIIGVFLLLNVFTEVSFLLATVLLFVFDFAGILAIIRGLNITCGCFGDLSPRITTGHVVITSVLVSLSIYATIIHLKSPPDGRSEIARDFP